MEEEFEKKSTKKVGIIVAVILFLLVAAIMGAIILISNKKPAKIFSKNVEEVFEMTDKELEDVNAGRVELELTAEVKGSNPQVKAMNGILSALKLKVISEYDENQKYFNENVIALYDNKEAINVSAMIQNDKMYFYLKDLFDKYIELDEEYLEDIDLSAIFEATTETVNKDLLKDIEKIILDKLDEKEFEKEKVELNGTNVQKSTLKLRPSELIELAQEVLEKTNEYEKSKDIEEIINSLEEMDPDDDAGYIEISIFTKGINNSIVKVQFLLVNEEDETTGGIDVEKKSDNETVIKFIMNYDSTDIDEAEEIFEVEVKEEDENKGTISLNISDKEDDITITLKMKYSIDNKAEIKPEKVKDSVKMDSLTEKDIEEIQENIKNNEALKNLLSLLGVDVDELFEEQTDYPTWDDDYSYDDDYSDWDDYSDTPTDIGIDEIINTYSTSNY